MNASSPRSDFRPDIQGLRGVAVLLVVLYHAGIPGIQGGYIGVDIFFVISGYLITGLLLREIEKSGKIGFVDFYARRARRLVPAATVVLIATTVVAWLIYSPVELKQYSSSAVATAVYLSNFWFARLSTDYLAEGTNANPLLHTWSLGVEEQFYLVWPFLLFLGATLGPAATLRCRLLYVFAGVGAVSLLGCIWLTFANQPWAFFGSPTRAWEFAAGGLIALWRPQQDVRGRLLVPAMGVCGALLILGATAFFTDRTLFPGYAALLPVLGAELIIAAGHVSAASGVGRLLGVRPLRFFGDISYSFYLWHWPVFVFLALEYSNEGWVMKAVGIGTALVLAWLTYVLVENPVRFNRVLARRAYASVTAALVLLAVSGGVAFMARGIATSALATEPHQRYFAAGTASPRVYADGCHADIFVVDLSDCRFGDPTSPVTVVLFGDSHAAQWFPALQKIAQREGWRLVSLTKSGCPSIAYTTFLRMLDRIYFECDAWRKNAFAWIEETRPLLTIVANSSRHTITKTGGVDEAGWAAATKRTLSELSGKSAATVVIKDTPWPPFNSPICLSRAAWRNMDRDRQCEFDPRSDTSNSIADIESNALSGFEGSFMLDMNDLVCPDSACVVERDGFVLYRDSHHLSVRFVEHLAEPLYRRLGPTLERARISHRNGVGSGS